MSYCIELTRGDAYGEPGPEISFSEWTTAVEAEPGLRFTDEGVQLSHRSGATLSWEAGVVITRSPDEETFEKLCALARSLNARLFGEDGEELGLSEMDTVCGVLKRAFPALDRSSLDESICRALLDISDPDLSPLRRSAGAESLSNLTPNQGRAALAYLLCRAVECGGNPEPEVIDAVVLLYPHDPPLVRQMRGPPMDDFLNAVDAELIARTKGPRWGLMGAGNLRADRA